MLKKLPPLVLCTCLSFLFQACQTTTIDSTVRSWDIGTAENGTKPDLLIRAIPSYMVRNRIGAPDSQRKTVLDGRECTVWIYNRTISRGLEHQMVAGKILGKESTVPVPPKEVVQKHLLEQILKVYFENDELIWVSMQESKAGSHSTSMAR